MVQEDVTQGSINDVEPESAIIEAKKGFLKIYCREDQKLNKQINMYDMDEDEDFPYTVDEITTILEKLFGWAGFGTTPAKRKAHYLARFEAQRPAPEPEEPETP